MKLQIESTMEVICSNSSFIDIAVVHNNAMITKKNLAKYPKTFLGTFGYFTSTILLLIALLPHSGEGEILQTGSNGRHNSYFQNPGAVPSPIAAKLTSAQNFPPVNGINVTSLRPRFSSKGTTYRVKIGSTVTMSCEIINLGSSVIVWKQTHRIISAGSRLIRKDSRMKLVRTNTGGIGLRIDNVSQDDRGEYICELETYGDPIHQINKLHVLVPPVISMLNPGRNITVRKGSTVKLVCNATGFPKPEIVWERQFQMLPSGEKEKSGEHLILHNTSRLDSGTYICGASNGVESPVDAKIKLKVIYEPEIQVEKVWVHADVGIEAEISCNVHAVPAAEVKWYRETMLVVPNEYRYTEHFGIRHTLVLRKVQREDFGNYSCRAENSLGRSRAFIELSGHPNQAVVTSRDNSYYSDHYNVTWSVRSFSEITEYRISYRKAIPRNDPMYDTRSRWHNVMPSMTQIFGNRKPPHQTGSYMFYALEPNSKYEVVVQSKNKWGWSQTSIPFFFKTRATDFKPKVDEMKPKAPDTDSSVPGMDVVTVEAKSDSENGPIQHQGFLPISTSAAIVPFSSSTYYHRYIITFITYIFLHHHILGLLMCQCATYQSVCHVMH